MTTGASPFDDLPIPDNPTSLDVVLEANDLGPSRGLLRRFCARRGAMAAAIFIILLCLAAVLAPILPITSPTATSLSDALTGPSAAHWLGCDEIGRDVLSRLVYASRISLLAAVTAVTVAVFLGLPLGLISGYFGGVVDQVLSRSMDTLFAIPQLLLAIVIIEALGTGLTSSMIAIGVVIAPEFFRVARGSTIDRVGELYIEAARLSGSSRRRIIIRHILPNIRGPLIVQVTLTMSTAIIAEAALSFIGLGVQLPQASWGSMLREAVEYIGTAPVPFVFGPAIVIVFVVLALNTFADGVRAAFGTQEAR
jgi:peptide/nickel transport system permease protein